MKENGKLILFMTGKIFAALPLSDVEKVVRAVQIYQVPRSPDLLYGMINVGGSILPVINTRKLFSLPEKELSLDDCLIIIRVSGRSLVLLVDHVAGVRDLDIQDVFKTGPLISGIKYLGGAACLENDIIYICNLDQFCASRDMQTIAALVKTFEHRNDSVNKGDS